MLTGYSGYDSTEIYPSEMHVDGDRVMTAMAPSNYAYEYMRKLIALFRLPIRFPMLYPHGEIG